MSVGGKERKQVGTRMLMSAYKISLVLGNEVGTLLIRRSHFRAGSSRKPCWLQTDTRINALHAVSINLNQHFPRFHRCRKSGNGEKRVCAVLRLAKDGWPRISRVNRFLRFGVARALRSCEAAFCVNGSFHVEIVRIWVMLRRYRGAHGADSSSSRRDFTRS